MHALMIAALASHSSSIPRTEGDFAAAELTRIKRGADHRPRPRNSGRAGLSGFPLPMDPDHHDHEPSPDKNDRGRLGNTGESLDTVGKVTERLELLGRFDERLPEVLGIPE